MDGEENETSKVSVSEPGIDVGNGESVAGAVEEVRVEELQCEPEAQPRSEPFDERLGCEPPGELAGTVGSDVAVGDETDVKEEAKNEDFENNGVKNEVAEEKDSEDEARADDKISEESAVTVDVIETEDALEKVEPSETMPEEVRFDDVLEPPPEDERVTRTPEKSGLPEAVTEESKSILGEENSASVTAVEEKETATAAERSGSADVAVEESKLIPDEEEGSANVAAAEPEVNHGLLDEAASEKPGLTDMAAVVAEESEMVPEDGGSADVALPMSTEEFEKVPEDDSLADVAATEVDLEMVPEDDGLADVAVAEVDSETVPEDDGLADMAATEVDSEMVPEDEGVANVAAAEVDSEMVQEDVNSAGLPAEEESEMAMEEGGFADHSASEETEIVPGKEGGLADVAAVESEDDKAESADVATEMEIGEGGSDDDLPAEETLEETVLADVAEEIGEAGMAGNDDAGGEEEEGEEEEEEVKDVTEEDDELPEEEDRDEAEPMEVAEEEEEEEEVEEAASHGKRKRGKNAKAPARASSRKKTEEDVCFICFDGGELVLCDRRGCPKAYHPTCVNRDDAFFRSKGRWNCGWHLCSNCGKNAYYMCYTCTFSLCKACVKGGTILCVRGNKGFCETCMKTVKLIEKNEGNENVDNVNFDDKSSWEYLFKDYYTDLKEKISLKQSEIADAKNPWKGSESHANKQESADEAFDPSNAGGSDTDGSSGNLGSNNSKRRKPRKRAKARPKDKDSRKKAVATKFVGISIDDGSDWASKELLEFVMHMRDGDASILSQFDVQALLLEYIKRNKLRDPRRKSQIICDPRLQNIFGKPRVGHFEMLKLLESHFLLKEDSQADNLQGNAVDTETSHLETDGNSDTPGKSSKERKRKSRRKSDTKGPQCNLEDYAAIDTHNINLIYLRRNLIEDLIDDAENFQIQAVGSFVRIRIAGNNQKQDLYRLVQVVGTSKAAEPYKVGKKITDTCLEILNLNKTETVAMDLISNQEFTEEECKRLRQSIKCGLINRLKVGDVQEKAIGLQAARVKDWLESEIVRLSHLRDRASDLGKKKELRECVEKLQLLKSQEERQRRLEEIPEIHTDPKMDPSFESEEEEADDKKRENFAKSRSSSFGRRGRDQISPRKGGSTEAWGGNRSYSNSTVSPERSRSRNYSRSSRSPERSRNLNYSHSSRSPERSRSMNYSHSSTSPERSRNTSYYNSSTSPELSRNSSGRGFSAQVKDNTGAGDIANDLWNNGRDRELQQSNNWDKQTGSRSTRSESSHLENKAVPTVVSELATKINESEKVWNYKDPSGKIQGPFSIVQLRKWNATGYFPANLTIWKQTENPDEDSLVLTDVLDGKIQKVKPQSQLPQNTTHTSPLQSNKLQIGAESWRSQNESGSFAGKVAITAPKPVEIPKHSSSEKWASTNLPSPTPIQTQTQTPVGPPKPQQPRESRWSAPPEPALNHDIQSVVSNLQSLVQSVASHLPPAETQGWVKPETMVSTPTPAAGESQHQQPWRLASAPPPPPAAQNVEPNNPHHWNDAPPSAGNNFPAGPAPSSDTWRPPAPPPQNPAWGPPSNQNMGWGPPPAPNPNPNWGIPPGNSGWGPPPNANPGPAWGPPPPAVQGWGPGNPNPNQNPNLNGGWGPERGHVSDRFGNNQDSGYGGGNQWNNRPPFGGGGGSRPPFRGQRICKFHESGHCKKGASCDYLHS